MSLKTSVANAAFRWPLPFGHGAPLRLRNEVQLGFKQVEWVKGVGFGYRQSI